MMLPDFSKNFANDPSLKKGAGGADSVKREPVTPPQEDSPVHRLDIRYVLSVLLLVLSIIGVGGLFGLNAYFDREIASIENGIGALEEVIKTNDILNLAQFDMQVRALKELSVSRSGYLLVLAEVSRLVVPGVYYSTVSIAFHEDVDGYAVSVKGVANSLIQYHQQIQRIESAEGALAGGVFEGYTLDRTEDGATTVLFTVSFEVSSEDVAALLENSS